jgi:hypothetical protein
MEEKQDNRANAKIAVNALKNSTTYVEFKMKIDILGLDMYNITVIRSLRGKIPRTMEKEFDEDVKENIDRPEFVKLAIKSIKNSLWGAGDSFSFGNYIANKWIEKHEREFRRGKRKSKYLKG